MPSPVPKYLRPESEYAAIPPLMRDHINDLTVIPRDTSSASKHPAKYQPGLASALVALAGTDSIGDPMAGSGTLVAETALPFALNEIDPAYEFRLNGLSQLYGCEVSFDDVRALTWSREVVIFSPPYYPRTDRRRPNAHDDAKRGPVVGFRDSYGRDKPAGFIGNPAGADGILHYRNAMREVYAALKDKCCRMIVVTKNWTRLGVELRLDIDTILTAAEVGWTITGRHGWTPKPSLWARFNAGRGTGVTIEDVLVFNRTIGGQTL